MLVVPYGDDLFVLGCLVCVRIVGCLGFLVWFIVVWVVVLALFCCAFDLLIVFVFWALIWLYCHGIVNSVV